MADGRHERVEVPRGDPAEPLRVMLVEDNTLFRRVMVGFLERQPDLEVVAQAGSLVEARKCAALVGFDVVVLDLSLPDGDGTELLADLRRACPGVAVLILSATLDPINISRARNFGANGVLDKFATPTEIVGAIRSLGDRIGSV